MFFFNFFISNRMEDFLPFTTLATAYRPLCQASSCFQMPCPALAGGPYTRPQGFDTSAGELV